MGAHDTRVTLNTIKSDISNTDSAIREAVANAIDAKSKNIYISIYKEKDKGALISTFEYFSLDIADDGDGIPIQTEDFEKVFCQYKVSYKKEKTNYGRKGKGRYTYLVLANSPDNVAIFTKKNNDIYKIYFECKDNANIKIHNEKFTQKINSQIKQKYNTLVQFKDLSRDKFNIEEETVEEYQDDIKNEIISFFADRIASESINIYINNELLKTEDYLEKVIKGVDIKVLSEDLEVNFKVDFYIWNEQVKLKSDRQKHILFFDNLSLLKGIAPSGKNKLAFASFKQNHSIIVKSSYFKNIDYIENSNDYNNILTDKTIQKLRAEITLKLESILFSIYQQNADKVSDEYLKFLELSKDDITQKAYHAIILPFIEKFGSKSVSPDIKSIIAKLIDTLVREAPDSYLTNIENILKLSPNDSKKIQYVEENYGIIRAITEKEKYIKRIDFLDKFDNLVNGKKRGSVQERTQLHHVIDKNLWLFGEFSEMFENLKSNDIGSDVSLKTNLENEDFFQFDSDDLNEIIKNYKVGKIPDIFIPIEKENTIYIIELKKPKAKISTTIMNDIMKKYVSTLNEINKKYDKQKQKKIYAIAISDTKNDNVFTLGNFDSDGITVVPKTWIDLTDNTRERYKDKINILDNKIKKSHWTNLEDFVLSHKKKIN